VSWRPGARDRVVHQRPRLVPADAQQPGRGLHVTPVSTSMARRSNRVVNRDIGSAHGSRTCNPVLGQSPRWAGVQEGQELAAVQMPPGAFLTVVVHAQSLSTLGQSNRCCRDGPPHTSTRPSATDSSPAAPSTAPPNPVTAGKARCHASNHHHAHPAQQLIERDRRRLRRSLPQPDQVTHTHENPEAPGNYKSPASSSIHEDRGYCSHARR